MDGVDVGLIVDVAVGVLEGEGVGVTVDVMVYVIVGMTVIV